MSDINSGKGMSAATARRLERSIIALCLISLVMIFQPFSKLLYGIGAGLVVLAGLSFNLVPLCQPGPLKIVIRAAGIVLLLLGWPGRCKIVIRAAGIVLLLLCVGLGVASAHLYGARRPRRRVGAPLRPST